MTGTQVTVWSGLCANLSEDKLLSNQNLGTQTDPEEVRKHHTNRPPRQLQAQSTQDARRDAKEMEPIDVNGVSTLHASNIKGKTFQFASRVLCGLGLVFSPALMFARSDSTCPIVWWCLSVCLSVCLGEARCDTMLPSNGVTGELLSES